MNREIINSEKGLHDLSIWTNVKETEMEKKIQYKDNTEDTINSSQFPLQKWQKHTTTS